MPHRIHQLQQHQAYLFPEKVVERKNKSNTSFKDVLSQEYVRVSKHAQQRLTERNLHISDEQWEKISLKMEEAKEKGVTDSLVMFNDIALLVSTKNNTVVTAMNQQEATSKIFTNINGTIVMND
ncbi:MAG TPA: TIGR02530 family flagellar biosynthesis protein [Bacillota bacterium]|nr:TIGR02530 family flagellar biosynthesis protein [Bacillota bacterium]